MLRRLLLAKDTIGSLTEAGLAHVQGGQQSAVNSAPAETANCADTSISACSLTTRAVSNPNHCLTTGQSQQAVVKS